MLTAPNVLTVRLGHSLRPGAYVVSWHVLSVDTHHTSGTYRFHGRALSLKPAPARSVRTGRSRSGDAAPAQEPNRIAASHRSS